MSKFCIGEVVTTKGINDLCLENGEFSEFTLKSLIRYWNNDWGDTCKEDAAQNDYAVEHDERILAEYRHPDHEDWRIWIITEWDRSATTILFLSEY